jgi:hypothetical protein
LRDFFEHYDRFLMPEPNSGCLLWIGAVASAGYGHGHRNGEHFYAHRSAFECASGECIAEGLVVRHRCDTPPCCNPDHLISGTQADNVMDSVSRGRANRAKGERAPKAILTEIDVLSARKLAQAGKHINQIAPFFPVHRTALTNAITGKTWRHLPLATPITRQSLKGVPSKFRGEKSWSAKLTDAQADEIRSAIANNVRGVDISRQYGISPCTVSAIKYRRIRK